LDPLPLPGRFSRGTLQRLGNHTRPKRFAEVDVRIGSFMPLGSRLWSDCLATLRDRFRGHEFLLGPEAAEAALGGLDAILGGRLPASVFEKAVSLKAVFVPFTGLNHLPIPLLIERGVKVYNVHGNAESVAEIALAMTLAHYGRLVEYHNDLAAERWHGFWVGKGAEDEWSSIFRRPCAILGTGAIGIVLAKLLKAFDCEVVGYRRRPGRELPPHFDRVETDLGRAIGSAEIVFVALPLTPATKGLLDRETLLSMKGKFLVNVGRGEIVDEEGLYLALRDGILRGAAIDTWYVYPQGGSTTGAPSRYPIHRLPNVIISPHVGGSTGESNVIAADQVAENIAEWLETGACTREADLREMY
jgi:phosphoglycerate dehydrogenase-like enzyme